MTPLLQNPPAPSAPGTSAGAAMSGRRPWTRVAVIAAVAPVLLVGVLLRLWVATFGLNYDLESWELIADLMAGGHNVYAHTDRYNYGPPWFHILDLVRRANSALGYHSAEDFHVSIVLLLSLADVGLALLVARRWGWTPALVYFLCPVTVLLTGYHSHFDSLAILAALASWLILLPRRQAQLAGADVTGSPGLVEQPRLRRLVLSAAIMGLSLVIKHVMILFPLWVLMCPALGRFRHRLAYAGIAYITFLACFVPYAFAPGAFRGIWEHVFGYDGVVDTGLLTRVAWTVIPLEAVLPGAFILTALKLAWVTIMLVTGRALALARPHQLFLDYLVAFALFALTMADQYLMYAVIPCAVMWRSPMALAYLLVATFALIVSPLNIRESATSELFGFFGFRSIDLQHVQVWLIPVLLGPLVVSQLLERLRVGIRFLLGRSHPPEN